MQKEETKDSKGCSLPIKGGNEKEPDFKCHICDCPKYKPAGPCKVCLACGTPSGGCS